MSNPYAAHQAFIRPARAVTHPVVIVLTLLLAGFFFMAAPVVFSLLLPTTHMRQAYFDGISGIGFIGQLATFGLVAAGFVWAMELLHKRGFWSLIGPPGAFGRDFMRVAMGVGLWLLVLEILPPWGIASDLVEMRNPLLWAILLIAALPALLIQVGTEELVFRGYLQQQLACLSDKPIVWLVGPSALFGLLHYWNGEGPAQGTIWALWAMVLGMACADLTARVGNLGPAMALHFVNNGFALFIVGITGWPGSGLALFLYPYEDPEQYAMGFEALASAGAILDILILLTGVAVMWLAARIALRR